MILPLISTSIALFSHLSIAIAVALPGDTLTTSQTLLPGGDTLISAGLRFEVGFFSTNSNLTYLGMWYHNLPQTIVWVANRAHPITSSTGKLLFSNLTGAVLYDGVSVVWNSSSVINHTRGTWFLQLLDTGNLVITNGSSYIWQSFDFPTDTLLPDMKLGVDLVTGLDRNMTAWANSGDPSPGEYSFSLGPPDAPQLVLRQGTSKQYRWGPWDGVRFSGSAVLRSNPVFSPKFVSDENEVYYTFEITDPSVLSRFVVTPQGALEYLRWNNDSGNWGLMANLQRDNCDRYGMCGPYGICYNDDPQCRCLKGFSPTSPQAWNSIDWTDGCVRKWGLDCGNGDGFVKYEGLKLPDYAHELDFVNFSPQQCGDECLNNCSCVAYTNIKIDGNRTNCLVWYGDLIDITNYPNGGESLYIRMGRNELKAIDDAKKRKLAVVIVVAIVSAAFGIVIIGLISWYIFRIQKAKRNDEIVNNPYHDYEVENEEEDLELPLFDLETISMATNKFSSQNKIGQGGFGPVYKGWLSTGQEFAVKRLSQSSGQGLQEFKNEVILIAKLQHRNLVKLLGCCISGDERMLIYEYMPNKSLDSFIFDESRRELLTWRTRFEIIMGTARGLVYLHQDSRLRIIHRDLKASNILLDADMNPKISDFGIARIYGGEQTHEKTLRVIGTYGYMAPEYAMSGHFSVKSDVFSFGVLLLEILSGKKNWGFRHPDHDLNLLGHAWKLWNEANALELMDPLMKGSFVGSDVARCVQVGLLCVQQRPEDRPSMSTVVLMLGNENTIETQPKEPAFSTENSSTGWKTDTYSDQTPLTATDSITVLHGR